VAFDGSYFVFVRYHDGHFIVEEPLAVTPASTERLLRALFSLSSGHTDDLTARLHAQWPQFFGEVAGYDAAGGKIRHQKERKWTGQRRRCGD